jgi:hypothetical protein
MYIILELQANDGNLTIVTPIQMAETKEEAMGIYYSILARAATSTIQAHSCMILDARGEVIARETFDHFSTGE